MSTDCFSAPLTPLDPAAATPAQKLALGRLLALRYARTWPEEPPLVPEAEAQTVLAPPAADLWRCTWAVWDGADALAWAQLEGDHTQHTHWASLHLLVHPEHEAGRGQALRAALWSAVMAAAQARGVSVVGAWGTDRYPEALAFLQAAGFRQTLSNAVVRLELSAVSAALLDAWTARPADGPYRLHRWTQVPQEALDRFADLKNVNNDMPRGDSELGELAYTPQSIRDQEKQAEAEGETRFVVAVEETRTGQLVAYSETYWGPQRAALVYQGATAVRREYRGRGLGQWVKAAMLLWLREAAPGASHIKTTVAEENSAMNGLNRALGFVPYATVSEWEKRLPPSGGRGGAAGEAHP